MSTTSPDVPDVPFIPAANVRGYIRWSKVKGSVQNGVHQGWSNLRQLELKHKNESNPLSFREVLCCPGFSPAEEFVVTKPTDQSSPKVEQNVKKGYIYRVVKIHFVQNQTIEEKPPTTPTTTDSDDGSTDAESESDSCDLRQARKQARRQAYKQTRRQKHGRKHPAKDQQPSNSLDSGQNSDSDQNSDDSNQSSADPQNCHSGPILKTRWGSNCLVWSYTFYNVMVVDYHSKQRVLGTKGGTSGKKLGSLDRIQMRYQSAKIIFRKFDQDGQVCQQSQGVVEYS